MSDKNYYQKAASIYEAGSNFIDETTLEGVLIINRPLFGDDRGFFREVFRKEDLIKHTGLEIDFVQSNHSRSPKNTLRGIHIAPWHKLVTCANGLVQQVVVDTRQNSPTFGQHISILMGEDNFRSVFIPAGCGNAFLVLSDTADYTYSTTDYWAPGMEKDLLWNDPKLNIEWQTQTPLVSEKDDNNPTLTEAFPEKSNQLI